jgi:uncharacterized protein (TIGR03437 family)
MRRHEQGLTRGVFSIPWQKSQPPGGTVGTACATVLSPRPAKLGQTVTLLGSLPRRVSRTVIAAGLLLGGAFCAASQTARPMAVMQTRYEVRMGEPIEVPVAADTLDFIAHAKTRRATADGQDVAGLVVGPNETQDKILLAPNSQATPGEYHVTLSATSSAGEAMSADVDVVVKPRQTVPTGSKRAPVVLLNGWMAGYAGTGACPISSSSSVTFGNLANYLVSDGVPIVYLFDNCVEGANQSIESLGGSLNSFLNSIKYDDGTQVTQIDVVAHSIGGLIVRAYLEGLQTNESYLPPYSPLIQNLVMIAVPNFGSFAVANNATEFELGSQGAELIPGSALLWNLATWNQRGDDLAGVNAIAIVGNAGSYTTLASSTSLLSASDGLVSTTSASLMFVTTTSTSNTFVNQPAADTRIVPYCHVDPSAFTTTLLGTFNCNQPGIANVTSTSHPTSVIVRSFLAGTTAWQSVGTAPTSDANLKTNGGMFFALQSAQAAFATDLTSVMWGTVALTNGGNSGTIYYTDFVTGTGDYAAVSSSLAPKGINCGTFPVTAGYFAATRCKINLAIACPASSSSTTSCSGPAVTPVIGPGNAVSTGSTIKITGVDFGSQCSNCKVYTTPAGATSPTALTVTSWTNTAISVQLPSTPDGYQTLQINGVAGVDSIGVRTIAPVPVLSLGSSTLNFAYTVGGTTPASQSFTISNTGTGTLTWTSSVTSTPAWLSVDSTSGTAPSTVNVSINPASLVAGTYTGTITIAASGASNSPATVTVTVVVTGAVVQPPVLSVTPTSLSFQYTSGSTLPAAQSLSITNAGGGTFTWVAASSDDWVALSAASGAPPGTVNVTLTPQNLGAGNHTATITVAAADGSLTPVSVTVTLAVTGNPPAPTITGVANAGGYQTTIASATWVAIFGTNLSRITYTWQGGDIVNGALPTTLEGVSVTINGIPAYVSFISPGATGSPSQINVLAPDDPTTGPVPVVVTVGGQASNSFTVQKNAVSPAFLTFDGTHAAAEHAKDYSLLGPPGLLPGGAFTPAAPGEAIILYGVGFGPTNPTTPTGQTVAAAAPLAGAVTMTIGGIAVTPSFAGLSESGLYQFNVTVPGSLSTGDALVSAAIGGVTTQTGVILTVQQ